MKIYFDGFVDANISYKDHQSDLESIGMSDFDFRQNMKKELEKLFTEAYASDGEQIKITGIRVK